MLYNKNNPKWPACCLFSNVLAVVLLLAATCLRLGQLYGPTTMPDEIGYWSAGAYFAGLNWSDVMPFSPYYSYGYGLLLAPLFSLSGNPVWMFRAAVLLNASFLAGSFFVAQRIAALLFGAVNTGYRRLACLALCLYSYLVYNVQGTQPDAVMVFFYWLTVWCLVSLLRRPGWGKTLLLAMCSTYLFVLHMRNLGVLIALCITLLLAAALRRVPARYVLCFIGLLAALALIALNYKNIYVALIWGNSEQANINNTTSVFSNTLHLFSLDGFASVAINFLGRLFYLGCSTFFLFYWAVYGIVQDLRRAVRCRRLTAFRTVEFFVLLALLGEMGISCLFMIHPGRIDQVLYGRYHEQVLPALLLFGLIRLKNLPKAKKFWTVMAALHLAAAAVLYFYLGQSGLAATDPSPASTVGITGFFLPGTDNVLRFTLMAAAETLVVFFVLLALLKQRWRWRLAGGLAVIGLCWALVGNHAASLLFYSGSEAKRVFSELSHYVQQQAPDGHYYYLMDEKMADRESFVLFSRKFFFPRQDLTPIDTEEVSSLPRQSRKSMVVLQESLLVDDAALAEEGFVPVAQYGSTYVWAVPESSLAE